MRTLRVDAGFIVSPFSMDLALSSPTRRTLALMPEHIASVAEKDVYQRRLRVEAMSSSNLEKGTAALVFTENSHAVSMTSRHLCISVSKESLYVNGKKNKSLQ